MLPLCVFVLLLGTETGTTFGLFEIKEQKTCVFLFLQMALLPLLGMV